MVGNGHEDLGGCLQCIYICIFESAYSIFVHTALDLCHVYNSMYTLIPLDTITIALLTGVSVDPE